MSFFILIVGILLLINVIGLRSRVQKLEKLIKNGGVQHISESNYQPQLPQTQTSPATVSSSLLDYIKQQFAQGVHKEDIAKNLVGAGWHAYDIEKAFKAANSTEQLNKDIHLSSPIDQDLSSKFADWLKEDWMLKLGALLLLIGFGWLTTYAFLNNWIGPMGRIALGIIAGTIFIILGWWRIQKYIHQGGIFLVLGSTVILLTIFAARGIYGFFTPASALVMMFLSTAFVAFASVKYNSRSLALASLILAGVAPLLVDAPTTDHVGLFAYLFIVTLGAIWIVALTGRRELTLAALILISFYSLPHILLLTKTTETLLLFAYAFTTLFFITNTIGILKLKGKDIIPDLIAAAGNGLFLLAWIMAVAPNEWKSLIISAWMIVFAVGAFSIFKITQRREPFYVYAGVGIAMLAAATSAELHGATLTIAYTIECGAISLLAYLFLRDIKIALRMNLLLIWPVVLSLNSIDSYVWRTGVIHKEFFVLLVLGLTFLGLGLFFLRNINKDSSMESRQLNIALLVVGSLYMYMLLWLSLHAGLENDNTAVLISLVVYTIIGLASYFYGLTNNKRGLQIYGGVLVGFVVARLFLVDIWRMVLAGRIITFFSIGALLVGTAFLGKKNRSSH